MAASSSADARALSTVERFERVRELGARTVPTWAAIESVSTGRKRLVLLERVSGVESTYSDTTREWIESARGLAMLDAPNVARVREAVLRDGEAFVVSDFVDGVLFEEMEIGAPASSVSQTPEVSLAIALRVIVDVLTGLGAIHDVRDPRDGATPLGLAHTALSPDSIVIGIDGVARVLPTGRRRCAPALRRGKVNGYLAPEVLLGDDTAGAPADIYGAGVLLWEALSGKPLFPGARAATIVMQIVGGRVPRAACSPSIAWAAPLAAVAERALSADPGKRFSSCAAMIAEIRRIVGTKLATTTRIASSVRTKAGERIRSRRQDLERGIVMEERSGIQPNTLARAAPTTEDESIDVDLRLSSVPPPPPPSSPAVSTSPPRRMSAGIARKLEVPTPFVSIVVPSAASPALFATDVDDAHASVPAPAPRARPRTMALPPPAPSVPPASIAVAVPAPPPVATVPMPRPEARAAEPSVLVPSRPPGAVSDQRRRPDPVPYGRNAPTVAPQRVQRRRRAVGVALLAAFAGLALATTVGWIVVRKASPAPIARVVAPLATTTSVTPPEPVTATSDPPSPESAQAGVTDPRSATSSSRASPPSPLRANDARSSPTEPVHGVKPRPGRRRHYEPQGI